MPGIQKDSDPSAVDLVGLASDLLKGIAAEPVPQHIVDLAEELQIALERQARKGKEDTDLPGAG